MALLTRRVVVQRAALAAAGLGSDAGAVRALAAKLSGQVITPGTPEYDSARLLFNRAFDRHPALIVRCAGASDIARTLDFARHRNLRVAVRGGGHNRAGLSSCDDGVVIDTSMMNRV